MTYTKKQMIFRLCAFALVLHMGNSYASESPISPSGSGSGSSSASGSGEKNCENCEVLASLNDNLANEYKVLSKKNNQLTEDLNLLTEDLNQAKDLSEAQYQTLNELEQKVTTAEKETQNFKEQLELAQQTYTSNEKLKQELEAANSTLTKQAQDCKNLNANISLLMSQFPIKTTDLQGIIRSEMNVEKASGGAQALGGCIGGIVGGFTAYGIVAALRLMPNDYRYEIGTAAVGAAAGALAGEHIASRLGQKHTANWHVKSGAFVQPQHNDATKTYSPVFALKE